MHIGSVVRHLVAAIVVCVTATGCSATGGTENGADDPTPTSSIQGHSVTDEITVQASGVPGVTTESSDPAVGRLYMLDSAGAVTECSAVLVNGPAGEPLLLSAAHCAYNATTGARFSSGVFALGDSTWETRAEHPHWAVQRVELSTRYVNAERTKSMSAADFMFVSLQGAGVELSAYHPYDVDFQATPAGGDTRLIGYPEAAGGGQRTCAATRGVGTFVRANTQFFIMPACGFGKGASGGPWVDSNGKVVGVTAILSGSDNYAPALGESAKKTWLAFS